MEQIRTQSNSEDWPGKEQGKWDPEAQEITRNFYRWFNEYFGKKRVEGTYEEER